MKGNHILRVGILVKLSKILAKLDNVEINRDIQKWELTVVEKSSEVPNQSLVKERLCQWHYSFQGSSSHSRNTEANS